MDSDKAHSQTPMRLKSNIRSGHPSIFGRGFFRWHHSYSVLIDTHYNINQDLPILPNRHPVVK